MNEDLRASLSLKIVAAFYRIILLLLGFSTVKAALFALGEKQQFLDRFPGASGSVYYAFLLLAVVGFVSLIGLFHYQRWAVWIFGILTVLITILNVTVQAPVLHTLSGVAAGALVLFLAWVLQPRFAKK